MLTVSHAAGANEPAVRDITLGELLQWAAETAPDRIALIAGVPDKENRRQWTYAELYAQSLRTARALRARFEPGERVAIWPTIFRMDHGGVWRRHGRRHSGNRQSRPQVGRVEYVLKQSRAAGIMVVTEFRGNPMLATAQALASRCPELREIIRFDQWEAFLASAIWQNPSFRTCDRPIR